MIMETVLEESNNREHSFGFLDSPTIGEETQFTNVHDMYQLVLEDQVVKVSLRSNPTIRVFVATSNGIDVFNLEEREFKKASLSPTFSIKGNPPFYSAFGSSVAHWKDYLEEPIMISKSEGPPGITEVSVDIGKVGYFNLSPDGTALVSSIEDGRTMQINKLISVGPENIPAPLSSPSVIYTLRRGQSTTKVRCTAFNSDCTLLAVVSDRPTLHIFSLTEHGNRKSMFSSYLGKVIDFFDSKWSFAYFNLSSSSSNNNTHYFEACCFDEFDRIHLFSKSRRHLTLEIDKENGGEAKETKSRSIISTERKYFSFDIVELQQECQILDPEKIYYFKVSGGEKVGPSSLCMSGREWVERSDPSMRFLVTPIRKQRIMIDSNYSNDELSKSNSVIVLKMYEKGGSFYRGARKVCEFVIPLIVEKKCALGFGYRRNMKVRTLFAQKKVGDVEPIMELSYRLTPVNFGSRICDLYPFNHLFSCFPSTMSVEDVGVSTISSKGPTKRMWRNYYEESVLQKIVSYLPVKDRFSSLFMCCRSMHRFPEDHSTKDLVEVTDCVTFQEWLDGYHRNHKLEKMNLRWITHSKVVRGLFGDEESEGEDIYHDSFEASTRGMIGIGLSIPKTFQEEIGMDSRRKYQPQLGRTIRHLRIGTWHFRRISNRYELEPIRQFMMILRSFPNLERLTIDNYSYESEMKVIRCDSENVITSPSTINRIFGKQKTRIDNQYDSLFQRNVEEEEEEEGEEDEEEEEDQKIIGSKIEYLNIPSTMKNCSKKLIVQNLKNSLKCLVLQECDPTLFQKFLKKKRPSKSSSSPFPQIENLFKLSRWSEEVLVGDCFDPCILEKEELRFFVLLVENRTAWEVCVEKSMKKKKNEENEEDGKNVFPIRIEIKSLCDQFVTSSSKKKMKKKKKKKKKNNRKKSKKKDDDDNNMSKQKISVDFDVVVRYILEGEEELLSKKKKKKKKRKRKYLKKRKKRKKIHKCIISLGKLDNNLEEESEEEEDDNNNTTTRSKNGVLVEMGIQKPSKKSRLKMLSVHLKVRVNKFKSEEEEEEEIRRKQKSERVIKNLDDTMDLLENYSFIDGFGVPPPKNKEEKDD